MKKLTGKEAKGKLLQINTAAIAFFHSFHSIVI